MGPTNKALGIVWSVATFAIIGWCNWLANANFWSLYCHALARFCNSRGSALKWRSGLYLHHRFELT